MMKKAKSPLRSRILFSMVILVIYGFGRNVPLPYTDPVATVQQLHQNSFWQLSSMAAGANFSTPTLFSLGLAPWMAGMIFWQLITMTKFFGLGKLSPKKTDLYRNIFILLIALFEGIGTVMLMKAKFIEIDNLKIALLVTVLIAGTFLLIWLASLNSVFGLGGPALLFLYVIIGSLSNQLKLLIRDIITYPQWQALLLLAGLVTIILTVIALAFIFELSEYRLEINRVMLSEKLLNTSYIPFKLNSGGSMAFMFGLTLLMLPQLIFRFLVEYYPGNKILVWLVNNSSSTSYFGVTIYCLTLFTLTLFFAYTMFDAKEVAEGFRKNGDYFSGVKPGKPTAAYLRSKQKTVAFIGATFTTVVAGCPLYLGVIWPKYAMVVMLPGMMIMMVGMATMIMFQVRAIKTLHNYDGLL